jgi:SAM-dependent methyltransferase
MSGQTSAMPDHPDLTRLRQEYADRERRLAGSDRYAPFNQANLFTHQQRQRATLVLLKKAGISSFKNQRILEMGCGSGGVLMEYLVHGANPACLHGIDLLPHRLEEAHTRLPHLPLTCADGRFLPYPTATFDLVLQYTAFSSILDQDIKKMIAQEMLRVLHAKGAILWYDFWLNPTNLHTRGIRPDEIRHLFPGCRFHFQRVTLAPPLARRLVPLSWLVAAILEKLSLFNSHYLVVINPI